MKRKLVNAAGLAFFGFLSASPALACSCIAAGPVCSAYWSTPLLFLGHVVQIEHVYDKPPEQITANGKTVTITGPGENLVHFEVAKSYRGNPDKQLIIRTPDQGSACGFDFQEGQDYLVYSFAAPNGQLSTGHCTRTHKVSNPGDDPDVKWLEALATAPAGDSIFGRVEKYQPNAEGGYDTERVSNVGVTISGPQSKVVLSDPDGNFRVEGLPPGKYEVSAATPAHYAEFRRSTVSLENRACAEVNFGTRIDGHIRGHVFLHDGSPASEIYLTARVSDPQNADHWRAKESHTSTATDGAFDFPELAPGNYIVAVNMDFPAVGNTAYYRRAFFPGTIDRSEAGVINVGEGKVVDKLRFFLPPDSAPPSVQIGVTVLGFDAQPVARATVLAEDSIWENSVSPVMATTDENGKATLILRPGSHYDIGSFVNRPNASQACAEPIGTDAHEPAAPVVLVLSKHAGNCGRMKKSTVTK